MSISYQFGDVDAHGALIRAQAASLEAEHQSIVRDVLAAGDFWGGAGSVACQEFITQLGRNFQVIYEQANGHGQKVQTAGNNMNSTDSAVALAGPDRSTPDYERGGAETVPPRLLYAHNTIGLTADSTIDDRHHRQPGGVVAGSSPAGHHPAGPGIDGPALRASQKHRRAHRASRVGGFGRAGDRR